MISGLQEKGAIGIREVVFEMNRLFLSMNIDPKYVMKSGRETMTR